MTDNTDLLELTARIASAHCGNNTVSAEALPGLIQQIYQALATVDEPAVPVEEKPTPAVPVKRSVFPDYIVCLEDGKKLKMLKRHLQSSYNMTPDEYRARWGLPSDYPMVAPSYAEKRSALARQIGLGRKGAGAGSGSPVEAEDADAGEEPAVKKIPERKRGRKAA